MLIRYEGNPILKPISEHPWESRMVYNCAAVHEGGKVHLVYRARGVDGGTSRFGYASSKDGFHIDERLAEPIFCGDPASDFECFGCEDPRLTKIGDRFYMCYTAYGLVPGISRRVGAIQIGITSISVNDFINHRWNWGERIYPFPRVDNKDACIFPEKIGGKWVMYHRIPPHIWVAYSDDLKEWDGLKIVMSPRGDWEYFKLGAGCPPIKTDKGWLFIYHAVSRDFHYRLGLALVDIKNPEKIIKRCKEPLLEPKEPYEKYGNVSNVIFTCGAVVIDGTLFLYYGGADTVICVATAKVSDLLDLVLK
ncbi:MAG: glycosidase [bacterium]|nr:glycosidase [bacterium]